MKKRLGALALAMGLMMGLVFCGCADQAADGLEATLFRDGVYVGFEDLPAYRTPEEALEDGCYVVVEWTDGTQGHLAGGGERWTEFLNRSEGGEDAFLRVVYFIDDVPYTNDLIYTGGAYHYYDMEYDDLTAKPYPYLRRLEGTVGNPEQEMAWYVLTDSLDLTLEQVQFYFYSSYLDESMPDFKWLGFLIYEEMGAEA